MPKVRFLRLRTNTRVGSVPGVVFLRRRSPVLRRNALASRPSLGRRCDMAEDSPGDTSRDPIWLTYQELAARLGMDPQSARRHAVRSRWREVAGDDGRARVAVPETVLAAADEVAAAVVTPTVPAAEGPGTHFLSQVEVLQAEVAEQRERAARAEGLAQARQERIAAVEAERDTARAELEAWQRLPWWRRMLVYRP